jgi:hypothetical protein
MDKTKIEKIGAALADLSGITSISRIDLAQKSTEETVGLFSKQFADDFAAVPLDTIINNSQMQKAVKVADPVFFQDKNEKGSTCFICVIPLFIEDVSVYCIVQAKSQIFETDGSILVLAAKLMAATGDVLFGKTASGDSRYKEELMKMRNTQARLFPKFDNIKGLDIAAVYLPMDLMTGTFLDAFHISLPDSDLRYYRQRCILVLCRGGRQDTCAVIFLFVYDAFGPDSTDRKPHLENHFRGSFASFPERVPDQPAYR